VSEIDAPSPAERARSVLARAASAHADWLDRETDSGNEPYPTALRGLMIDDPEECSTVIGCAVLVEIADPAPIAARERIRARVRLLGHGSMMPDQPDVLRLSPFTIDLEEAGVRTSISPPELLTAKPDPFACSEAALLSHLDSAHAGAMADLAAQVDGPHANDIGQIRPIALDRFGLVLRIQHEHGHRDARLPFPTPATNPEELRLAIRTLTMKGASIRGCRRRHDAASQAPEVRQPPIARGARFLTDLFRAGPAAARISSPDSDDQEP
jgi:hypothetical protein